MRNIQVGIYLDFRSGPHTSLERVYSISLELCEEAERLGAASVWLSEHHGFDNDYLPQPLTAAAAIAARTRTLRIGTAVLLAPLRSAREIAEAAAVGALLSSR